MSNATIEVKELDGPHGGVYTVVGFWRGDGGMATIATDLSFDKAKSLASDMIDGSTPAPFPTDWIAVVKSYEMHRGNAPMYYSIRRTSGGA